MSENTPNTTPQDDSQPSQLLSMLFAPQENIDIHFGAIMANTGLNSIEKAFDVRSSMTEHLKQVGSFLLKCIESIPPNLRLM